MSSEPRFASTPSRIEPPAAARRDPLAAIPDRGCPPVIEEWLRESRARLLRRYGGLAGPILPEGRLDR